MNFLSIGFFLIIFVFIILIWKILMKPNKQKKHISNNLIKSSTCGPGHPSVIFLFTDNNDTELVALWNTIIKNFDPETYSFAIKGKNDCKCGKECESSHKFWKIGSTPCIRSYGKKWRCAPNHFDEYIGNFDEKSIREFITSK